MPEPSSPADHREAIRDLLAEYSRLWDENRFADVAALFTASGEWRSRMGAASGPEAIEALLRGIAAKRLEAGTPPVRRHFCANTGIRLDGDAAHAASDFFVLQQTTQGLVAVSLGSYRDTLHLQEGAWRFARREIIHHV